ncbi:MAG: T9SS type A sorting domain-containing protein [Candidatus Zixiibacteriota bacterium]
MIFRARINYFSDYEHHLFLLAAAACLICLTCATTLPPQRLLYQYQFDGDRPRLRIGPFDMVVNVDALPSSNADSISSPWTLVVSIKSESYPGAAAHTTLSIDSITLNLGVNPLVLPTNCTIAPASKPNADSGHVGDKGEIRQRRTYELGPTATGSTTIPHGILPGTLSVRFWCNSTNSEGGSESRWLACDELIKHQSTNGFTYSLPVQEYPNPFSPTSTITYEVPGNCHVMLVIYNVQGQMVDTLVNEDQVAGPHNCIWNGRPSMANLPSGVYFYKLEACDFKATKKFILLK